MSYNVWNVNGAFTAVSGGSGALNVVRLSAYGEGVAATQQTFSLRTGTGSPSTSITPEKTNSRSPASVATYFETGSGSNILLIMECAIFNHQSLPFSGRYFPRMINGEMLKYFGTAVAPGDANGSFLESDKVQSRSIRRRTSRSGYHPCFGNEIHHHAKTGGGAFSQICPHFDNDIYWTDPSAWRNGMCQSDVWNIQLFGTVFARSFGVVNGA